MTDLDKAITLLELQKQFDGSRVKYDKENPRVEIEIEAAGGAAVRGGLNEIFKKV